MSYTRLEPGKIVKTTSGDIGMIIRGPVKETMTGFIYQVMLKEGLKWVYPEQIYAIQNEESLK